MLQLIAFSKNLVRVMCTEGKGFSDNNLLRDSHHLYLTKTGSCKISNMVTRSWLSQDGLLHNGRYHMAMEEEFEIDSEKENDWKLHPWSHRNK